CFDTESEQTCSSAGQWETPVDCPFVCTSDACGGVCEPDDTKCEDASNVQTCGDDGQWGLGEECPFVCVADDCGGNCTPDTQRCFNNTPQLCSDVGEYGNITAACGAAQICELESNVASCVANDPYCVGGCSQLGTPA